MPATVSNKDLATTTRQWLAALGIKTNASFVKEQITTHQDYPAITAIADFLDAGNMKYSAVQADASYINDFNYPLLAHVRQGGGGLSTCSS